MGYLGFSLLNEGGACGINFFVILALSRTPEYRGELKVDGIPTHPLSCHGERNYLHHLLMCMCKDSYLDGTLIH